MTQSKAIVLKAQKRSKVQKAKALRRKGLIAAVVYGPKVKSLSVVIDAREAEKAYHQAGTSHLIDLKIQGKAYKVLIYDAQFDPVKNHIVHLDFYAVPLDKPIRTEVPLEFKGEPPVVKNKGGVLLTEKDSVEVECLPQDLIDKIAVDLRGLKDLHDVVKIADLEVPKGIEIIEDKEVVVATVQAPRSEEELAELEETPVEDVDAVEVEKGKEEETEEKSEEAEEQEQTLGQKEEAERKSQEQE